MQEKRALDDDITRILSRYSLQENGDEGFSETNDSEGNDLETIHIYIYREEPKRNSIVDADIPKDTVHSLGLVIACFIFSLLPIFSITFQIFVLLNSSLATITLVPIQKELSAKADMQLVTTNPTSNEILSHLLAPITISESKIAPTTGKGHQNAAYAKGTITFYNGSSTSHIVPVDTQLTGRDGVHVVTDTSITIPPATASTPPTFGEASVYAHAIVTGPGGNIEAEDINSYSLGPSILAQNIYAFRGGMNARDFSFVTKNDIATALTPLTLEVTQTVQTQLFSEVAAGQSLIPPSCSSSIHSDHNLGDEATNVKVSVSQTCKALTYDTASLQAKGSQILMSLAQNTLGVHFFPIYSIQTNVVRAAISSVFPMRASISVFIHGIWVYQFSAKEIEQMRELIIGKPTDKALQEIQTLPEVKEVRIQFQGFGNSYYLPKDQKYIRVAVLYRLA